MRYQSVIEANFDVVSASGEEFLCRCPWHQDGSKPNLYINAVRGCYVCHSCGAKGHLAKLHDLPPISVTDLKEKIGRLGEVPTPPVYYPEGWLKQYDFPHEYWQQRGITPGSIKRFNLGYDPFSNNLTIPLRDVHNRIMGVIQRVTDNSKPKYRYPKGFPIGRHLFAAWMVRKRHPRLAIVEGSLDAIACWDARIPAVGLLGSRLTKDQAAILGHLGTRHVVLMLDNDAAGRGWPQDAPDPRTGRPRPAAGLWQVHDALVGSGILVSVGWYRSYWSDKDPAALKPDRRRKMFHSALSWRQWCESQGNLG